MSLDMLDLECRLIGPDSPEAAETTYNLATMKLKQGQKEGSGFFSSAMQLTMAYRRETL